MSTSRTLVEPYIPEIAVRFLRLEAHGEVGRSVRRCAHQHAVIIDLVAKNLLLYAQRDVRHGGGEGQLRVGIQRLSLIHI